MDGTAQAQVENQQVQDEIAKSEDSAVQSEKMIPKELFDKKISEMNQKNKALKAELEKRMTDDERIASERAEKNAEMQSLKNELAGLKTESSLVAAGVNPENAKTLSTAIISGDISAIVEAVQSAINATEKSAVAKATKELLENGSPKIQTTSTSTEKPDPNLELIKGAVHCSQAVIPKETSGWFK